MGNRNSHEDISPAELDALWREPPYTLAVANEHFPGNDLMAQGSGEESEGPGAESGEGGEESQSYWKRKEAFARGSTVSLAVGERFSSDVVLVFSGRRRASAVPDADLQEALRTRLRVVESNSQDVIQLFKDLSARLLSVHAEKDSFVITFKTVEEIWKFSTYLALGYVARCLENFLCDQSFWLDPELLSDLEINVSLNEEHLATLYLGLLLQEGSFFAKALYGSSEKSEEEEELAFGKNDLLMVRDTGQDSMWEGTLLPDGRHGLVPVSAMQPLPYPFYQWFLRKFPGCAGGSASDRGQLPHPIVTGVCVAVEDYSPVCGEDLQLSRGDRVEVQGLLLRGLDMFVGTNSSTGRFGFVRQAHVQPLDTKPLDGQLVFLTEEERAGLALVNPFSTEPSDRSLLDRLFSSDISTVYRLDRLDESDFTYIRNQPKQDPKTPTSTRQSLISEKSGGTPPYHSSPRASVSQPSPRPSPRPSLHQSQNPVGRDGELLSFSLEDTFRELDVFQDNPPLFLEDASWEGDEGELCDPTLTLLNHSNFQESFLPLYDLQCSFLGEMFGGQSEEDLLGHLEGAREAAKRAGMHWAHRRACFLLGRLSAKKLKYSQARVYYEESLNVRVDGFSDLPLLTALYTNLTSVYLKQRMTDKLPQTLERACALLLCLPSHSFTSLDEFELLCLLLRRAVVEGNKHLEARVCYLTASLFLLLGKSEDALAFVERLQFLTVTLSVEEGRPIAPLDLNWLLCRLYNRKYMPYLALASLSLDTRQDHSLQEAFQRIQLFVRNSVRLNPHWREGTSLLPAQIVVYLQHALALAEQGSDLKTQRDLCLGLACVYQQYGALERALPCAQRAVAAGASINEEEGFQASVLLGWLLVMTGRPEGGLHTLRPLLLSLQGTDSPTQRGVIHNLLALCLRRQGCVREAGHHLHCALRISQESGNQRNQALALANLGCLALGAGAPAVAERFLVRSLSLFLEIWESPTDEEHVQTYLWLGRSYKDRGRSQNVRLCYEMGLLIALQARNLHSQMVVSKTLSRLYADLLLYGQSIIYYEHCVSVSRELKDKRLEGEYLEILSSLYLTLNTEKSSRKSLDCSKQSLRISIDLGKREEESETWLQVGRIYYLIHEDELADMYLQAAVKTALRMNDPHFAMSIYEEAGDVFFKGHRNRMASLPFYRDGSLPFARSIRDVQSEFRLLSKLTELLSCQGEHKEALQYAVLAVEVSSHTGVCVNERAAYHRLASAHYSLQQYELSENYYLKSLSLCPPILQHPSEARYYTKLYCRLGDLTMYKLKDAHDAVGYFQLALAAALEDQESPQALYVICMKLAEIYANHMPDAQLCQAYRERARSLRRQLSGQGVSESREGGEGGVEGGGEGEVEGGVEDARVEGGDTGRRQVETEHAEETDLCCTRSTRQKHVASKAGTPPADSRRTETGAGRPDSRDTDGERRETGHAGAETGRTENRVEDAETEREWNGRSETDTEAAAEHPENLHPDAEPEAGARHEENNRTGTEMESENPGTGTETEAGHTATHFTEAKTNPTRKVTENGCDDSDHANTTRANPVKRLEEDSELHMRCSEPTEETNDEGHSQGDPDKDLDPGHVNAGESD
ncbi:SH3 domain and tetratricopeptide repeat-containing protein 2 isoform X3 [Osmerus eperlanus]|uniref:SH3 domain and tetratricopeptide repeat-containing protein 2 isoform X3 n=1 Tax=Osmerus eperlanus TaxID=29151 RepID=UPI002E11501C